MYRHQTTGRDRMRLGKHDERGRQLIHIVHALYAISIEERLKYRVVAGHGARVRYRQPRGELSAANLQSDDRYLALLSLRERPREPLWIARGFHEEAHYSC